MFNAIKGRHWILLPNIITVKDSNARANIFKVNDKVLIPVIHGKGSIAKLIVRLPYNLLDKETILAKVLYPGRMEWKKIAAKKYKEEMEIDISLLKGCALLSLE
jgi:hypothetical protein